MRAWGSSHTDVIGRQTKSQNHEKTTSSPTKSSQMLQRSPHSCSVSVPPPLPTLRNPIRSHKAACTIEQERETFRMVLYEDVCMSQTATEKPGRSRGGDQNRVIERCTMSSPTGPSPFTLQPFKPFNSSPLPCRFCTTQSFFPSTFGYVFSILYVKGSRPISRLTHNHLLYSLFGYSQVERLVRTEVRERLVRTEVRTGIRLSSRSLRVLDSWPLFRCFSSREMDIEILDRSPHGTQAHHLFRF